MSRVVSVCTAEQWDSHRPPWSNRHSLIDHRLDSQRACRTRRGHGSVRGNRSVPPPRLRGEVSHRPGRRREFPRFSYRVSLRRGDGRCYSGRCPLPILDRGRCGCLGEVAGRQGLDGQASYPCEATPPVIEFATLPDLTANRLSSVSIANTLVFYSRERACASNEKGAASVIDLSRRYAGSWASRSRLRGDAGLRGLHRPIFHARRLEVVHCKRVCYSDIQAGAR